MIPGTDTLKGPRTAIERPTSEQADRIRRILDRLDAIAKPEDMNLPGRKFHALKGNRKGTFAVSVSGNWRITFAFREGDATDIDLEDYH